MDMLQGKHFSITDPKGVSTVIYQIYSRKIRMFRRNKRRI